MRIFAPLAPRSNTKIEVPIIDRLPPQIGRRGLSHAVDATPEATPESRCHTQYRVAPLRVVKPRVYVPLLLHFRDVVFELRVDVKAGPLGGANGIVSLFSAP